MPGDNYRSIFNEENPNYVEVIDKIELTNNNDYALFRIPPIEFDTFTQPAQLTDCSGGSKANMGDELTIFGLGENTANFYEYADSMIGKCFQVLEQTEQCDSVAVDKGMANNYFCADSDYCYYDQGGPIVAVRNKIAYVVSMVENTGRTCDSKCRQFQFLEYSKFNCFVSLIFQDR